MRIFGKYYIMYVVVFIFKVPGPFSGEYNAFVLEKVFHAHNDETTCLDWSFDSRVIAVGSRNMTVKLFPLQKLVFKELLKFYSHETNIK